MMFHFVSWTFPLFFGVAGGPPGERTQVVFETTPGFEQQVADSLADRISSAGFELETIETGPDGRITARLTLGLFEDERLWSVTQPGAFGAYPVLAHDLTDCPDPPMSDEQCLLSPDTGLNLRVSGTPVFDNAGLMVAEPGFDSSRFPTIDFRLTAQASAVFCAWTNENIGTSLALVIDGILLSAPVIQSPICGGSGQITGNFSVEQVTGLAIAIAREPLPVPVTAIESIPLPPVAPNRPAARDFPGPPRRY